MRWFWQSHHPQPPPPEPYLPRYVQPIISTRSHLPSSRTGGGGSTLLPPAGGRTGGRSWFSRSRSRSQSTTATTGRRGRGREPVISSTPLLLSSGARGTSYYYPQPQPHQVHGQARGYHAQTYPGGYTSTSTDRRYTGYPGLNGVGQPTGVRSVAFQGRERGERRRVRWGSATVRVVR